MVHTIMKHFSTFCLAKYDLKPIIKIDKTTIEFIKRQVLMNKKKRGKPYKQWKPENGRHHKAIEQIDWDGFVKNEEYGSRSAIEGIIGSFKGRFGESFFSKLNTMIFKEMITRVLVWNVMRA